MFDVIQLIGKDVEIIEEADLDNFSDDQTRPLYCQRYSSCLRYESDTGKSSRRTCGRVGVLCPYDILVEEEFD